MNKIDKAVILMAGKGTRFLPATKAVAKELFPVGNIPVLLYHLLECKRCGIKEVTLVISKQKKDVIKFLQHDKQIEALVSGTDKDKLLNEWREVVDNLKFHFVYQGKRNGTGGALSYAKKYVKDSPFVFFYGDDLCLPKDGGEYVTKELLETYGKTGKTVLAVLQVPKSKTSMYGIVKTGKQLSENTYEVAGIVEKPKTGLEPSNLATVAKYVLKPSIFENLLKCQAHENGEIYLPEAIAMDIKDGGVVACKFSAKYFDMGNKLEFIKCMIENGLKDKNICDQLRQYLQELL